MSQNDSDFIRTFALVVGGLMALAIVLLVFANIFHNMLTPEVSEARQEAISARIAPIGAVYAGEAGKQALAKIEKQQATASASSGGGPMSGEQVFQNVCSACHGTGAGGAPQLEMEYWKDRIAKGEDTLKQHALNGFQGDKGLMPAKGGNPSLSDEEVKKAVDYMLAQVKGSSGG